MQRPTGAPLPLVGGYRAQSRTQPNHRPATHPSTSHVSPSSASSSSAHLRTSEENFHRLKRNHRDAEDSYPNQRTPPPKRAKPLTSAAMIDTTKSGVVDDGSIYHLNALMTTKMMTEEMRGQILDIIESQFHIEIWLDVRGLRTLTKSDIVLTGGSRRMIPMCTVPRAAPNIRTEQSYATSTVMPYQDRLDPDERIDGRRAHARTRDFQEHTTPHRDFRTYERSPSPLQALQMVGATCNIPEHAHHQNQPQQRVYHRQDRYEPHTILASGVPQTAAANPSVSHQCAQQCFVQNHPDKSHGSHPPADRYRTPNACNYDPSLTNVMQPQHQSLDSADMHHLSPFTMRTTNQSPEIERTRGIRRERADSGRQDRGGQTSGREVDADLTMSTRTTRTGNGDPDTSYGFDLGLDFDEPTKGIARRRRHQNDQDEEDVGGEKDDTGSERGSENESETGTMAGKAPRSKTRNELANAILSHPEAQLLQGSQRCPNCRNAKRSIKECWVIAGKKGKCAPCTRSSQKCPFLLSVPGQIDEDEITPEKTASVSNTFMLELTQTVCDFAAHGKAIANILSAWEPGNPAFEGFARKSLEAVAKDISAETLKLKDLLKGM